MMEIDTNLIQEFHRASPSHKITQPWMAIAEQQAMAWRLQKAPIRIFASHYPEQSQPELAEILLEAKTYLWRPQVYDAVRECPLPKHVIARDILPYPNTYHTFEVEYEIDLTKIFPQGHPLEVTIIGLQWLLFVENSIGIDCYAYLCSSEKPIDCLMQSYIPYGATFPDDFTEDNDPKVHLSMLAFLNSPDKHVQSSSLPRSMRKDSSYSTTTRQKQFSVVTLSSSASQRTKSYKESIERNYQHQWWVAGHFRSQWYPSRQAHNLKWIAPYLKGPEDKPILKRVYNVAQANQEVSCH